MARLRRRLEGRLSGAGARPRDAPASAAAALPPAPRMSDPRAGRWRRTRRVALGVAVALVVVEVALRVARPPLLDAIRQRTFRVERADADYITLQSINFDPRDGEALIVYDPDCFWRMAPDREGEFFLTPRVRTNALGLRGPEVGARVPGELRLLCVGDSVTFGFGVAEDERFSDRLAASLSAAHPERRWTTVNAGVIGFSSFQVASCLDEWLAAVEPDVVLVTLGVNDSLLTATCDRDFQALASAPAARLRHSLRGSQTWCALEGGLAWLARAVDGWRTGRPRAVVHWLDYPSLPQGPGRVPRGSEADVLAALAAIDARCRERAVELVLVSEFTSAEVPSLGRLDAGYFDRIERLTNTIARWAAERGLRFADVRGVLARSGRPHAELLRDFCHPTPAGHVLIADELARVGEEAGWPTRRRER